jgi:hypothetical protein
MKLYHPAWTIKDPLEMLRAIGKLEKTDIDYTLLTESVIGVRPVDLFRTMKLAGLEPSNIDKFLFQANGELIPGISMKSLDVAGDWYRVVYHVQGFGNIAAATDDPEARNLDFLISSRSGLYDTPKEKVLYEYASFLGFEVS